MRAPGAVGDAIIAEHIGVEDHWMVKFGKRELLSEAIAADEFDAISTNRHDTAMRPMSELGNIEYGRADHAMMGDQPVVFEINTNPFLGVLSRPHPLPSKNEAARGCRGS